MARADGGRDGLGVPLHLSDARRGGDGDGNGVVPRAGLPRQKEHEFAAQDEGRFLRRANFWKIVLYFENVEIVKIICYNGISSVWMLILFLHLL